MAAALPFIAVAMTAVGTLTSAMGAYQQGKDAKRAADFNAAVAERNAGIARQQAAQEAMLQQREARQRIGAAAAAYGASGVTLEGSPLDVLEASASAAELDKQTILYRGELRAMGYTDEATLSRFQGESAYRRGINQAASTILVGGAKVAGMSDGLGGSAKKPAQAGYSLGDWGFN